MIVKPNKFKKTKYSSINPENQKIRRQFVSFQLLVTLTAAGFFLCIFGQAPALSSLAGGVSVMVPNMVFASLALSYSRASQLHKIVSLFYWGEATKILLTLLLVTLALSSGEIDMLYFLVTFSIVTSVGWVVFLYVKQ
jgi:ATP synthase protein I